MLAMLYEVNLGIHYFDLNYSLMSRALLETLLALHH